MDFVSQFEHTLEQTINRGLLTEAEQLLSAFKTTGLGYTRKLYALINLLRRMEAPFDLPMTPAAPEHPYRIVIFRTGNYILDYIAERFSSFFKGQGCSILFFDPADYADSTQRFFTFTKDGTDAAFFFNNVGLSQTFEDGSSLWESLNIPCYDFLVDHPMYYADSLDNPPCNTTLLCADRTHTEYVRRFYTKIKNALFLPTGGCQDSSPVTDWNKRDIDVLFIGSYKYHASYTEDELDRQIIAYLSKNTTQTFEQAVEYCAGKLHISDTPLKTLIELHRFTETNLTALYRKAIMEDLVSAGIMVHVYGNGWEQSGLQNHNNFILHSPVSFEEGIRLMSHTKILLNHMAWFKDGSSERIFNAMMQGALCITDSSSYLDTILSDGINCCIYQLKDCRSAPLSRTVKMLLSSPEKAEKIASDGQKTAMEHTWEKHLLLMTEPPPV